MPATPDWDGGDPALGRQQFLAKCQGCHGAVEATEKLYLVPDNSWWYGVPVKKLEMGWCIQCHRANAQQASQDCMRCHH